MTPKVDNINTAKPIALASHKANVEEKHYHKNDLEVTVIDFALLRFRNVKLGSTENETTATDHQPLFAIFNGRKKGSKVSKYLFANEKKIYYEIKYN